MARAIGTVMLWAAIGTGISCALLMLSRPRMTWRMIRDGLNTLEMVTMISVSLYRSARSWRRRFSYVGNHRAERFQVVAPVMDAVS